MKKLYCKWGAVLVFFFLFSCSQKTKDECIKADLTTKSKSELNFAGINYTVDKGVVSLSGICSSEKDKTTVESKVKGIAGVKEVVNNIANGPVVIGTDFGLKQSVDSVLKKYPKAEALVKDSAVTLQGSVAPDAIAKIMTGLQTLQPKSIDNKLMAE
jgi:basic membrane lipoprotein Med (substrate-binding protein (PBP1-ABC) superfamily)